MTNASRIWPSALLAGIVLLVAALVSPAVAGDLPIAWDAVQDGDLDGYNVYHGTSPNGYGPPVDAGMATTFNLTGLQDCTRHYVAVKARDTEGLESSQYSNELNGLPTPTIGGVSPSSGEQGQSVAVTITGTNFDTGATVTVGNPDITVQSVSIVSCTEIQATFVIGGSAATGFTSVEVTNADQSYGTLASAFQVTAQTPPTVQSTTPANGASNVALDIRPTVTFSEAMDPATVTTTTVRLLTTGGSPVAQAPGSPVLNGAGTVATITPADDLTGDATYRIQVIGGGGGVRDLTGTPMSTTFEQSPGFTTGTAPDTTPPTVGATSPADNADDVTVSVAPTVSFSEPMDPASISASTVRLLDPSGSPVAQAPGSPSLNGAGTVVTITPADDLDERVRHRIEVIGGSGGVTDQAGNPLGSTYRQNPGFRTENLPPGRVRNVVRIDTR